MKLKFILVISIILFVGINSFNINRIRKLVKSIQESQKLDKRGTEFYEDLDWESLDDRNQVKAWQQVIDDQIYDELYDEDIISGREELIVQDVELGYDGRQETNVYRILVSSNIDDYYCFVKLNKDQSQILEFAFTSENQQFRPLYDGVDYIDTSVNFDLNTKQNQKQSQSFDDEDDSNDEWSLLSDLHKELILKRNTLKNLEKKRQNASPDEKAKLYALIKQTRNENLDLQQQLNSEISLDADASEVQQIQDSSQQLIQLYAQLDKTLDQSQRQSIMNQIKAIEIQNDSIVQQHANIEAKPEVQVASQQLTKVDDKIQTLTNQLASAASDQKEVLQNQIETAQLEKEAVVESVEGGQDDEECSDKEIVDVVAVEEEEEQEECQQEEEEEDQEELDQITKKVIEEMKKEKIREEILEDEDLIEAGQTKSLVNQSRIDQMVRESEQKEELLLELKKQQQIEALLNSRTDNGLIDEMCEQELKQELEDKKALQSSANYNDDEEMTDLKKDRLIAEIKDSVLEAIINQENEDKQAITDAIEQFTALLDLNQSDLIDLQIAVQKIVQDDPNHPDFLNGESLQIKQYLKNVIQQYQDDVDDANTLSEDTIDQDQLDQADIDEVQQITHKYSQMDDLYISSSPSEYFYSDEEAQRILLAFNEFLMNSNQSFGTVVKYFKQNVYETHEIKQIPVKFYRYYFRDDEGQELVLKYYKDFVTNYILIDSNGNQINKVQNCRVQIMRDNEDEVQQDEAQQDDKQQGDAQQDDEQQVDEEQVQVEDKFAPVENPVQKVQEQVPSQEQSKNQNVSSSTKLLRLSKIHKAQKTLIY